MSPIPSDRALWVSTLVKIAQPVLAALAEGKLRERMPVEARVGYQSGNWSSKRIWAGQDAECDHALSESRHPTLGGINSSASPEQRAA